MWKARSLFMLRNYRYGTAVIAGLALVLASDHADAELGVAETTAACCQLTTSFASEKLRGSDTPGDERFFKGEAAPPNIHFILDTSYSMVWPAQADPMNEALFFNSDP